MRENLELQAYPNTSVDCPPVPYPPSMHRWFELCDEYPYLKHLCGFPRQEPAPPPAMPDDDFLNLVGSLRNDFQRAILQELLLDLLADGVAEIVKAMTERRNK